MNAVAPIITLTQVSNGEGVTKPSMRPAMMKTITSPMMIDTDRWVSATSDCARVLSPGTINDQPIRRPAPPATMIAVISRRPCGRMSPQNLGASPAS